MSYFVEPRRPRESRPGPLCQMGGCPDLHAGGPTTWRHIEFWLCAKHSAAIESAKDWLTEKEREK